MAKAVLEFSLKMLLTALHLPAAPLDLNKIPGHTTMNLGVLVGSLEMLFK